MPPKEVIIMDEYGQRLRDPVGPYNEGAHLTVICEAEGGIDSIQFSKFYKSIIEMNLYFDCCAIISLAK